MLAEEMKATELRLPTMGGTRSSDTSDGKAAAWKMKSRTAVLRKTSLQRQQIFDAVALRVTFA
jgi:hypothetical protein